MVSLLALALPACGGREPGGNGADLAAARGPAALASAQVARTPGMCGWWEDADSATLASCRTLALRSLGPPADSLFPGTCGVYQVVHLDSLRACLGRAESLAAECPVVGSWPLRQPDGQVRRAEWRRCGPPSPEWRDQRAVYPRHHVLLRATAAETSPAIFALDNAEEEGFSGYDEVTSVDLDLDGSDELFLIERIYGTGAFFTTCALTVREGRILCWSQPDFDVDSLGIRQGEVLYKGWIPVPGPPREAAMGGAPRIAPGRSIWYFTPVYALGDSNCCSSVNASLWFEVRPGNGRFEAGLLLRSREDSLGAVLSVDTLRR